MISPKQLEILKFPYSNYQALICDGSVRAGKTSICMIAFVDYAMNNFNNTNFAICGKTVGSAIKNIVTPFLALTLTKERYITQFRRSDNCLTVRRGNIENVFYVYGGKDESSYMLIQGITLAAVLLDEVALMAQSFVQQALARCLSYPNRKYFFNCNPDSPNHWFYNEWILNLEAHNAMHLNFQLWDNPALSAETIEEAKNTWQGVFYDRYILGKWVIAEGLIYPMFNEEFHVVPTIPRPYEAYWISMDYGIQNPTVMTLYGLCDGVYYAIKEYYHSGRETKEQKTDTEYYDELLKLAGDLPIKLVIIDPSASSFIALIRRKGKFSVKKADNAVLDGIRETATALKLGLIKFNDCCERGLEEFGLYMWDDRAIEDTPVKDNDHFMDNLKYFVKTQKIAIGKRKPLLG